MTAQTKVRNLPLTHYSTYREIHLLQTIIHQDVCVCSCYEEIIYDPASGVNLALVFPKFAQATPVKITFVKLKLTDWVSTYCQSLHTSEIDN